MNGETDRPDKEKDSDGEFGLTPPSDDAIRNNADRKHRNAGHSTSSHAGKPKSASASGTATPWRGFEEEEIDPDPAIDFAAGKKLPEDELDMTPMVDVVFLLLIFFMVTASFTLRKSFEQAHSQVEDPSQNVVEPKEDEDDFIEVIIDQTNTFYIRTRDTEEIEAPSEREMRDTMRAARDIAGTERLIIRAHVDALHSKVVRVLDTANSVGMRRIETVVTDVDY